MPGASARAWRARRRALHRTELLDVLVDDGAPAGRAFRRDGATAEAAPGRPEHHRDEGADDADDEQDVADGVNVEAGRRDVDGESEDGADRDQDQADSDTHVVGSFLSSRRFRGRNARAAEMVTPAKWAFSSQKTREPRLPWQAFPTRSSSSATATSSACAPTGSGRAGSSSRS